MHKRFAYDVFLSHNAQDGLRVWCNEWVIYPGDSIPLKIEQG